jgi:regulatory protein YycI of two-component signal transduction system YycFG
LDLSRAKIILIIAFLSLNLFLGFRLWLSPQYLQTSGVLTDEEAEQAKEVLVSAGYEVLTTVPRHIPRLSLLHVSRLPQQPASWPKSIWGDVPVEQMLAGTGNIVYTYGEETLEIATNGVVTLHVAKPPQISTGEDPRSLVERFLKERNLWFDDLKYDLSVQRDGALVRYRYLQTYQGVPLFFSYTDVKMVDGSLAEVKLYRVVPLGFTEQEIQTVSAAEAADAFVQSADSPGNRTIIDISLGYYSQDYDAERWEIVPVWRFASTDGTAFYINAFTGEAEL